MKKLVKLYSAVDIARIEGINNKTVANRPDKYIPIRIDNAKGRQTKRGYSVRYLRVSDVDDYLEEFKK